MRLQDGWLFTACRLWRILLRAGIFWAAAAAAVLVLCLCETAAVGRVVHGSLAANLAALLFLGGVVSAAVTLFQAGWFRFNESGYGLHNPWRGRRSGGRWEDVGFIGLVPGNAAGARAAVMLLIVEADGTVRAMEYIPGLEQKLLRLHPGLRIAALPEEPRVRAICRRLDEEEIGWLPLARVEHMDGSSELVLRSALRRSAQPERERDNG